MTETISPPRRLPARTTFGLPRTMFPVAAFASFDAFAFYGMQTILVYYVYFELTDGGLGLPVDVALAVVSAYGGAVFLATIFMGWIADRVLGSGRILRWGAVIAIAGYASLAIIPGTVGLTIGLVMVAFGASSMWVGEGTILSGTLEAYDAKRESGFTVYYLGSAGGATVGIALTGILQSSVGFRIGFAVTALVMLIGLLVYLPFRRSTESTAPVQPQTDLVRGWRLAVPLLVVAVVVATLITAIANGFNPALLIASIALLLAVVYFTRFFTSASVTKHERTRILHYLPFFFATMIFGALYQQLFTTIAVHSEAQTERHLLGLELPPSTILSIAPFCTLVVGPILAAVWGKLGERQPSLGIKFAIASGVCGAALLSLAVAAGSGNLTPLIILIFIVFAFGASDVIVSPSGLSMATAVAPKGFETQMLSVHYLGVAIGIAGAGVAAGAFTPGENETAYFVGLAVAAFLVAAGMIVVRYAFGRKPAA